MSDFSDKMLVWDKKSSGKYIRSFLVVHRRFFVQQSMSQLVCKRESASFKRNTLIDDNDWDMPCLSLSVNSTCQAGNLVGRGITRILKP